MRTIKFRAWDKLDNKMYYNVGLSLIGVQVYANPESHLPEEIVLDRGRDCFEIMQFTGLLDDDGEEIYEGDVVKIPGLKKSQVVWGEKGAWLLKEINTYLYYAIDGHDYPPVEVVGNIYENPESLK